MVNEEYLPETPMQVLTLLPSTKQQVIIFTDSLIESVKNGEKSALEVKSFLKVVEIIAKSFDDGTKENQRKEADLYNEKTFSYSCFEIEKSEVGVKYDYLKCGDIEYNDLSNQLKVLTDKIKKRESFLKTITSKLNVLNVLNDETGEVYEIYPPLRTSTDGLKFKLV